MPKTVFVLGAGASCDFKFPTGEGLATAIREQLAREFREPYPQDINKHPIRLALMSNTRGGETGDDHRAAHRLISALGNPTTIDQILHINRDNPRLVEIGKLAIAIQILRHEGETELAKCEWGNLRSAADRVHNCSTLWPALLLSKLAGLRAPDDVAAAFDDVAFVTFNYDRSLEQYLRFALATTWHRTQAQVATILARIPIVHVYGSLHGSPGGESVYASVGSLAAAAAGISTFTEPFADRERLQLIHSYLLAAKNIVFLGFGFDLWNVRRLWPSDPPSQQAIFGTSLGLHRDDEQAVLEFFGGGKRRPQHTLWPVDCQTLIREHSRPFLPKPTIDLDILA